MDQYINFPPILYQLTHFSNPAKPKMEIADQLAADQLATDQLVEANGNKLNKKKMMVKKMGARNRSSRISFSASLPSDAHGVYAENSICAVLYSTDPFDDLRKSMMEMIREVGVCDWREMEELVYCYIALNSSEVHRFIWDAFLSLFTC